LKIANKSGNGQSEANKSMKKSIGAQTFVYPHPVFLVGSYDIHGKANIMAASWAGICCSDPPCVAVSLRKATYSYSCIIHSRAFTINIPSVEQMEKTDYAGIYSGRDRDKFAAAGYTPIPSKLVAAPYVAECSVVLECKLAHTFELGLHTQFVGEILDVQAEESVLGDNGLPDLLKVNPLLFSMSDRSYYSAGRWLAKAFSIGKRIPADA
jgi:flavin reductase (DIM6/NTAB) family NADH-FMN oxidoreductase RutF